MTQIVSFSAKKEGGKTTAANFLFGIALLHLDKIDHFSMSKTGKLVVPGENGYMELDLASNPSQIVPEVVEFMEREVWPYIKVYNFADPMKDFCIRVLGLEWKQCYGTNAEKDTLTTIDWANMPNCPKEKKKAGKMTGREVLQYFGTNVMRKIEDNLWVNATLRQIHMESPAIALIGDCRFPNEVNGIQGVGGKVIRLTKNSESQDSHSSETALDKENFDWAKFDAVVDNEKMSIDEQSEVILKLMGEMGIFNIGVENNEGVFKAKS